MSADNQPSPSNEGIIPPEYTAGINAVLQGMQVVMNTAFAAPITNTDQLHAWGEILATQSAVIQALAVATTAIVNNMPTLQMNTSSSIPVAKDTLKTETGANRQANFDTTISSSHTVADFRHHIDGGENISYSALHARIKAAVKHAGIDISAYKVGHRYELPDDIFQTILSNLNTASLRSKEPRQGKKKAS